jgi:hypothetical protein
MSEDTIYNNRMIIGGALIFLAILIFLGMGILAVREMK